MTSIKCEITATTIANEVRLLSAVSHESFLLVEGTTDKSLFRNFCDTDKCEIIVATVGKTCLAQWMRFPPRTLRMLLDIVIATTSMKLVIQNTME